MLKREFYKTRNDGVNLYKSYSDLGYYIKQNETGNLYAEAIDIEDTEYTYTETNEKIEQTEEDLTLKAEIEKIWKEEILNELR